jgi:SEC-C motif-containing protein
MSNCPCGFEKEYKDCCELIHNDQSKATSPELLMRARYSAFVVNKVEFVDQTNIPGTKDFNLTDAKKWAKDSDWHHLEVVGTKDLSDTEGLVEFKAFYKDVEKTNQTHHEQGHFKKVDDLWFYTDGKIVTQGTITREGPKIGRNDPCPCESGKKFKKCCGK